jgi:Leucine-rich repeat (LRR) protein
MRLVNSLLVVWLFSFSLASADQPVNIPDPSLKAAIEAQLWVSDPTPADMLGLTRLCANNQRIGDLTGLQYATNLVELELTNNRIHSISVVS